MTIEAITRFINETHIVTVLVALLGWFILIAGWYFVHRLTAKRDRANHNRQLRTNFLIGAFQKLANAANRPASPDSQYFRDMEAAIADIQLFGSRWQIQLIESFTSEFGEKGMASLDPLLKSLRDDLRNDLQYESVDANVRWFRPEGSPITESMEQSPTNGSSTIIDLQLSQIGYEADVTAS